MRIVLLAVAVTIATFAGVSHAQSPMIPQTIGPQGPHSAVPMIPNAGSAMIPNGPGAVVPPPTCSNSLDFTDGCNSQYLGMMRL